VAHIYAVNVNDAFSKIVGDIHTGRLPIIKTSSRNGDVLQIIEPVTITYSKPNQRVLFNQARDSIQYYITDFEKFSDDGETLNGAYGYRWRHAKTELDVENIQLVPVEFPEGELTSENMPYCPSFEELAQVDQLQVIINHLKAKPDSRRAVLSMWNVEDDLLKIGIPQECIKKNSQGVCSPPTHVHNCPVVKPSLKLTREGSKDVACNLNCTFQIINGHLDMTVFNRSNDAILGSLGANVVHFSFLLEYMATHIGVPVGKYNQVSTNLHVYTWNWKPEEWIKEDLYSYIGIDHFPLVKDPRVFDAELAMFNSQWLGKDLTNVAPFKHCFTEPFFADVAFPMAIAFHQHKKREYESALSWCSKIKAEDWRWVAQKWVEKRMKKWNDRNPYSAKILGEV
jgi:thymidylate synthase